MKKIRNISIKRRMMAIFAALALPILWPRYITEKRLCTRRGAGEAAAFILPAP